MKIPTCKILLALALLGGAVIELRAQTFSVDWFKVAGGGGTSTNSTYSISGTFGQPDTGGPMAGGGFSVVGGFWSLFAPVNPPVLPPSIVQQPASQTVLVGSNVMFTVLATGTVPLSYQWCKNGSNIGGASNTSLALAGVTTNDSGKYMVIVSNPYVSVTSSVAVLTVNEVPISRIFVVSTNGMSGGTIVVPIKLGALGNENALGFSLTYDPMALSFQSAQLGAAVASGSLFVNPSFTNIGRLGVAVSQPFGSAFAAGTQEVVVISFLAQPVTNTISSIIAFADVPTARQLVDPLAEILPATYVAGTVTLSPSGLPPAGYEADVWPRPGGDHAVTIADWVQVGRFVAGLDVVTNDDEFLRADCAPRANLGNGNLTVADWVQAGRYAVGLDPLTIVGGPTAKKGFTASSLVAMGLEAAAGDPMRGLRLGSASGQAGQSIRVPVLLSAQGDENALGFSVGFDPALMDFSGATAGAGAPGASFNINTAAAAQGKVGLLVAQPPGGVFAAGTQQVAVLEFGIKQEAINGAAFTFSDNPVVREVSDATANVLSTSYVDSQVAINPWPELQIEPQGANVVISWPASSGAFVLQSADTPSSGSWNPVAVEVVTNGLTAAVTVPATNAQAYYRLRGK